MLNKLYNLTNPKPNCYLLIIIKLDLRQKIPLFYLQKIKFSCLYSICQFTLYKNKNNTHFVDYINNYLIDNRKIIPLIEDIEIDLVTYEGDLIDWEKYNLDKEKIIGDIFEMITEFYE